MSFRFRWESIFSSTSSISADSGGSIFSEETCRVNLEKALNSFPLPGKLIGPISVKELCLGKVPPSLEIMEISVLEGNRFAGIFRFSYEGDARVIIECPVQVNPVSSGGVVSAGNALGTKKGGTVGSNTTTKTSFSTNTSTSTNSHYQRNSIRALLDARESVVAASAPLVVPMKLEIYDAVIDSIFAFSVSRGTELADAGAHLSFKNEPLKRVSISSTFDNVPSLKELIEREVFALLKNAIEVMLPEKLHEKSLELISGHLSFKVDDDDYVDVHVDDVKNVHCENGDFSDDGIEKENDPFLSSQKDSAIDLAVGSSKSQSHYYNDKIGILSVRRSQDLPETKEAIFETCKCIICRGSSSANVAHDQNVQKSAMVFDKLIGNRSSSSSFRVGDAAKLLWIKSFPCELFEDEDKNDDEYKARTRRYSIECDQGVSMRKNKESRSTLSSINNQSHKNRHRIRNKLKTTHHNPCPMDETKLPSTSNLANSCNLYRIDPSLGKIKRLLISQCTLSPFTVSIPHTAIRSKVGGSGRNGSDHPISQTSNLLASSSSSSSSICTLSNTIFITTANDHSFPDDPATKERIGLLDKNHSKPPTSRVSLNLKGIHRWKEKRQLK